MGRMSTSTAPVPPAGDVRQRGAGAGAPRTRSEAAGLECPGCGARYRRVALRPGEAAACTRCAQVLARGGGADAQAQLALASAAFIVFLIAMLAPIAEIRIGSAATRATLMDAMAATWAAGQPALALLTFATACLFPLGVIVLLGHVLLEQRSGRDGAALARSARALRWLMRWSMAEVLLLAGLIAWSRSAALATASVGPGLVAFGVLSLLFTACEDAAAEDLHDTVPERVPMDLGLQRGWAYLVAAVILYLPSNLLPVTTAHTLTDLRHQYTLLGGVIELWRAGAWDLAAIVFIASLVVPLVKMVALALLFATAQRRSAWRRRERTALARLVNGVGHWSMLDVYVVVLLTAMVSFGVLAGVEPGPGLVAFGAVVVLTMLSAESFDTRWIWADER
jgi:paraquat-inducible protein A